ncbi:hypothetical protein TWF481_001439 [Arthrobotrys musiformis]|uniref:Uncharacterized protein n=1 Tax=Arthrobotrys musiformis TaxID=47236 RepID=A0AAV9WRF6_9PEZI
MEDAGDLDDDDPYLIDWEDEIGNESPGSGSGNQPKVVKDLNEAFQRGEKVEKDFSEKMQSIPERDPEFDSSILNNAVFYRKNIKGVPLEAAEVTRRMIPELQLDRFDVGNRLSYQGLNRIELDGEGRPISGGKNLLAFISKENQHLYFNTANERFPKNEALRDWVYQIWVKASESDAGDPQSPLKFITFQEYRDKDTYSYLKDVLVLWEQMGYSKELDAGFVVRKSDIDEGLSAAYPLGHADLRAKIFTILHGIPLVSVMVDMLSTFPNTFQRYEVSEIGFEVWEGSEPDGLSGLSQQMEDQENEPHFNVAIKLDRKTAVTTPPGAEGASVRIYREGATSVEEFSRHPFHADMSRTSYGSTPNPTFTKLRVTYFGMEYLFYLSRSERHIVIDTVSLEVAPEDTIILMPADRDPVEDFVDVIYSTWNREAGQMALRDLTFSQIRPRDRDQILEIRSRQKPESSDKVSLFWSRDKDFRDVRKSLRRAREGKVLDGLLQRYKRDLGISGVSKIEIGIFKKDSTLLRKNSPFIFVGFRPMEEDVEIDA